MQGYHAATKDFASAVDLDENSKKDSNGFHQNNLIIKLFASTTMTPHLKVFWRIYYLRKYF